MNQRIMTLLAGLIAAATLTARPAAAQTMPGGNFNQMIQNQIRMQQIGDQMARNAARAYYQYALRLRQQGYKGEIPTGVTAQSLNAANQAVAQAGSNYIQNSQANIRRNQDAITSTNNAITRGCASQYWNGSRWICQ